MLAAVRASVRGARVSLRLGPRSSAFGRRVVVGPRVLSGASATRLRGRMVSEPFVVPQRLRPRALRLAGGRGPSFELPGNEIAGGAGRLRERDRPRLRASGVGSRRGSSLPAEPAGRRTWAKRGARVGGGRCARPGGGCARLSARPVTRVARRRVGLSPHPMVAHRPSGLWLTRVSSKPPKKGWGETV